MSGPATSYDYDQAGNLTSVSRSSEAETPAIADSYSYNGDGLRTAQTSGATTKQLTWDEAESLPLILNDGTYSYVYGPADTPIEQIDSEGHVLYIHHDQQDSVRMLTSEGGAVEGTTSYDAYGGVSEHIGSAISLLGYDSQDTNSDSGLIYLRARSYDPGTAQFMSVDPLVATTGEAYGYAGDDPVDAADPSGQCGVLCIGGLILGGVAVLSGVAEVAAPVIGLGEGAAAVLNSVSAVAGAGAGAVALDGASCVQSVQKGGSPGSCIAAGVGLVSTAGTAAVAIGVSDAVASGAKALSIPVCGLAELIDGVDALVDPADAESCG
jgi:RHS repeat-associated protein